MKSYTDLEQSKKLAEILPLESADMSWILVNYGDEAGSRHEPSLATYKTGSFFRDRIFPKDHTIPAWSLTKLLDILKDKIIFGGASDNEWFVSYTTKNPTKVSFIYKSNLVDACYEMIISLNELNLL